MFKICNHKWGLINDGYQYCEKCGKAIAVKCSHNYIIKGTLRVSLGGVNKGYIYVLMCDNCGHMKNHVANGYSC